MSTCINIYQVQICIFHTTQTFDSTVTKNIHSRKQHIFLNTNIPFFYVSATNQLIISLQIFGEKKFDISKSLKKQRNLTMTEYRALYMSNKYFITQFFMKIKMNILNITKKYVYKCNLIHRAIFSFLLYDFFYK